MSKPINVILEMLRGKRAIELIKGVKPAQKS